MLVTSRNGLGITVNEMQRSINGLGHARAGIIPYDDWQPFNPGAITRGFGDQASEDELRRNLAVAAERNRLVGLLSAADEKNQRLKNILSVVMVMTTLTTVMSTAGWLFERSARKRRR